MSLRIGAKNFVLMAHRLRRRTQILANRFAFAFRPDGVGATLCRPVRRNGVMNCAVYFDVQSPIIVACVQLFCADVYSPLVGRRADIKWPLRHPRPKHDYCCPDCVCIVQIRRLSVLGSSVW